MRRKLKDKKGASLVFAIVIFLMAMIISLTIVGAAVTNAQKVKRQRAGQQGMLAVSSAARYVQHLFDGCGYYFDPKAGASGTWKVSYGNSELGKLAEKDPTFGTDFEGLVQGTRTGVMGVPFNWVITTTDNEINLNKSLDVNIECTLDDTHNVDSKYNIVAKISKVSEKGTLTDDCITLVFTANVFEDENGNEEYTWTYASIDRQY